MEIKKLETEIKELKLKVGQEKTGGAEISVVRGAKKRLRRAQRKKRTMVKRAAFLEAKSKKKERTAS